MTDFDIEDDGPEADHDDYDRPETPPRDEPNCYACNDRGCPECGHVNPADPEHQTYLAREVLQARALGSHLDYTGRAHEIADAVGNVVGATEAHAAAVRRLVDTAVVTITWPEPGDGPFSDESPF